MFALLASIIVLGAALGRYAGLDSNSLKNLYTARSNKRASGCGLCAGVQDAAESEIGQLWPLERQPGQRQRAGKAPARSSGHRLFYEVPGKLAGFTVHCVGI